MGKSIIWGHGRDGGDDKKIIAMMVAILVALYIVVFILIGGMSNYHGGWGSPRVYGIRFGDGVLVATNLRVMLAFVFIGLGIVGHIQLKSFFNSRIDVCEDGVRGMSKSKEAFELKYNQISSVHSQDEGRGNWKSVIVNVSGKTFQVYTIRCNEIVAEINKRRGA
jgi:hypothetical protein